MINIAIIEDEKKEQELLKEFFKKLSESLNEKISLKVFNNGKEFLFNLEFGIFDLVLMDIELSSDINGIQVSEKLREIDSEVVLVFMTNLSQYAIEGYKVKAVDYIVKPISYFDFSNRMTAIFNNINTKKVQKVLIQSNGVKVVLLVKDIFFVEVLNHSLIYHTKNGDFMCRGSLNNAKKELKDYHFSLCNSCFLVNLAHVESVEGYNAVVHGEKLLISHPKRKKFLIDLSRYLGQ